jgi:hypothetical protein
MKFLHHPILRFFKRAKDINKHKKREGNGKKKRETCACHENKKENTSRNMATLETLVSMQEQNIKHMKINIGT